MKAQTDDTRDSLPSTCGEVAAAYTPLTQPPADADLTRIVAAWPHLPEPIKAAVRALIGAAGK